MKLDKYWALTLISLLLSLLIGLAAYFTTFLFSKQVFLKISRENVANYLEVTAVAAGSKKKLDELREVLKRSPYVEEVSLEGRRVEDPFTLDKTLIFPDGTAAVSIRLDKELVEERASALARSVSLIVFTINLVFQLFFLLILRLLYLKPLKEIRDEIDGIEEGTFQKLKEKGQDEFGRIRRSINMMIDRIKERDVRAEIISQFIHLLTVGKGFNGEFVELMRRVLEISGMDGVIIGRFVRKERDRIELRVIGREFSEVKKVNTEELEGIEPYILLTEKEVETSKEELFSKREKELGIRYVVGFPVKAFKNLRGFVIFFKESKDPVTPETKKFLRNIARSISVASEIRELFEDLREKLRKEEKLVQEMIRTLVRGIEIRDSYTRGHSERVAYFSKKIAENMGLTSEKVNEVYMAALLHDIGKIGIPDSILLKPSRLTEKEYEIIKLHPILSYELLKNIEFLKGALDGIKYHHERWDGSGYPDGLKGKDIPLIARIIAVADSFDAMTSERIYRKGFSKVEAVKEIKALAGKHYDPEVVNNAVHILLSETPPTAEDYLSAKTIKEIEERRLDYFLRDSLTGVFSRNALEFAYALFKEKHGSFKAFALDVVKLREINIREGWKKGDEILKEVVKKLEEIEGAAIVRYSGDNFIIFTPEGLPDEVVREKIEECENRLNVQLRLTKLKNVGDVELLKQELTKLEFEENW